MVLIYEQKRLQSAMQNFPFYKTYVFYSAVKTVFYPQKRAQIYTSTALIHFSLSKQSHN